MNEFLDTIQKIQNKITRQLDKMQRICHRCKIRGSAVRKRPTYRVELCNEYFQEYLSHAEKKLY